AGNVAFWNRALFDAEDGLAGVAIEDEHQAGFADGYERGNFLAVFIDFDKSRSGRQIVVPEVVVDGLEIPLQLSGVGVDGDDGIAEEIIAGTIATIVIGRRAAHGHEESIGLWIDSHIPAPDVSARAVFQAIAEPCVMADFAGQRDGMESPN